MTTKLMLLSHPGHTTKVASGESCQGISSIDPVVGQNIALHSKQESGQVMKLKDAICLDVLQIRIDSTPGYDAVFAYTREKVDDPWHAVRPHKLQDLAMRNGFENPADMAESLSISAGLPFVGYLVTWGLA